MGQATALIARCDRSLGETIDGLIRPICGLSAYHVDSLEAAKAAIEESDVALAVLYLGAASATSDLVDLIDTIEASGRNIGVLALTELSDGDFRLKVLDLGAIDCLSRPINLTRLAMFLDLYTVRARSRTAAERQRSAKAARDKSPADFLFEGPQLLELKARLARVAPLESTVLLHGETGVGKTQLARTIHELSPRRKKPFVVVHCANLSASLLESELFGHVRGAFTSADANRTGKFSEAEDGTVFLDEIDCLAPHSQAKLLRALEERVFEPVGSTRTQPFRARLVAAANRPLEKLVAAGEFRSDLYYRLNVLKFDLPPLRDCPELIGALAEKFVRQYANRHRSPVRGLSGGALTALRAYEWPGNVRELRNVIEQCVALAGGHSIELGDLPMHIAGRAVDAHEAHRAPERPIVAAGGAAQPHYRNELQSARKDAEKNRLLEVLSKNRNNRARAAKELQISRMTLYRKLHEFGFA